MFNEAQERVRLFYRAQLDKLKTGRPLFVFEVEELRRTRLKWLGLLE